MGSSLSLIVANIFKEAFEQQTKTKREEERKYRSTRTKNTSMSTLRRWSNWYIKEPVAKEYYYTVQYY